VKKRGMREIVLEKRVGSIEMRDVPDEKMIFRR
jgi:hypothetical protein